MQPWFYSFVMWPRTFVQSFLCLKCCCNWEHGTRGDSRTNMEMTTTDSLSLFADLHFLLGGAVIWLLLNYLLWELWGLLQSRLAWERISLGGCRMQPLLLPRLLAKLWPVSEWVRSKARALQGALNTSGERISQAPWHHINHLLCDDPACIICEQAAHEAGQHPVSAGIPSPEAPKSLKLSPPGRRGHPVFPRNASVPASTSVTFDLERPCSCRPPLQSPEMIKKPNHLPEGHVAHDRDEHSNPSSRQSKVEAFTSSSSISHFTWTKSSSGLSEFSIDSLKFSGAVRHLKMVLTEQEDSQESSWTDSEASSEHQLRPQTSPSPKKRPSSQTHPLGTAAHLPAGASKDQVTECRAVSALFLEEDVTASLESHILAKRIQHHLGLPSILLRSLRSFMLPSPDLTPGRLRRELGVSTRPQPLLFLGADAQKKLELHLKQMVHVKRWHLPRRIQRALGQMKPPIEPTEEMLPPSAGIPGPGVRGQLEGTRGKQRTPARPLATQGVLDTKTTAASQGELQSHLVKKSLEIRLETFPMIVGCSQKMSSRSRRQHLPKSISPGQSCPQWRNRLCLLLRGKADVVEMNIKCKYIHFLWGLPTLYMRSLSKMAPSAPTMPQIPALVHGTIPFVGMEPPFVETSDLECHVLRKRLQHGWGLPGLVIRSMRQFLVPVPSSPAHAASVPCGSLRVKILTQETEFLSADWKTKERLEAHLKAKIIERRWGLPRRALDSLRMFTLAAPPPGTRRPSEDKKTFALSRGEKAKRRKPYPRAPRTPKKQMVSSRKVLQRHLTKKALEVWLGAIAPLVQQSRDAAYLEGKKQALPKLILPGLRPLAPRPRQLLFVDQATLGQLQLNIIHKGLVHRWGLVTTYTKSLARMFPVTGTSPVAQPPSKSNKAEFTAVRTPFLSQGHREGLEWHVRRKSLQHIWGLPGLVHKSLHYLLPTTISRGPQKGRHAEVTVSLTEPAFLNAATRRELERNVQKRTISQHWQLPKRVLQSLRMLQPAWTTDDISQNPPQVPFAGSRRRFSREVGRPNLPAAPIRDALCTACYIRETGDAAPWRSQGFPMLGAKNLDKIELHLSKKCLALQLEAFPAVIERSRKHMSSTSRLPLPKLIPPGWKLLQPRKVSLPLVSQEDAGRMEVAMQVCRMRSLWGLGTQYVEGLRAMFPSTPIHSFERRRRTVLEFSEGQALFLNGHSQEALELHVIKKRLQHEWGLPILMQSSTRAFIQGLPPAPAFSRTTTHIQTLLQDLDFLSQGTCSHLEHHLQRLKLQRQWGLPLRVLKSLRWMMPATETHPDEKTTVHPVGSSSIVSNSRFHRRSGVEDAMNTKDNEEVPETAATTLCRMCQGSTLSGEALEKVQQHLARKSVEIHLEVLPAVPRRSWRQVLLSLKQPLPRLIPPGNRVLGPRQASFPFLRTEEMERVELAVRCSRLVSLWGLGMRYVETLNALAPSLPLHPIKSQRAAFGLPEGWPPCFQGLDPAPLEMHLKKKKMQHAWGIPAFVLRSLDGFMQRTPIQPPLSKTVIYSDAVPQDVSFLPRAASHLLEFHIQRMKLQRRWGLPSRILASLKPFLPSTSPVKSSLYLSYKEEPFEQAGSITGETQRALWVGRTTKYVSLKQKGLENHLKRKDLEIRLEAFPAQVIHSKAAASGWEKTHLPKLVRAGQKTPKSRVVCPSFLPPSSMTLLEVSVKQKHLAFLWGLPSQYVTSLFVFAPRGHDPVGFSHKRIWFREAKTPFCQKETRERLEYHVQKKRLHHHWGLPSAVQQSLQALAPPPSSVTRPRLEISKEINVLVADVPCISVPAQKVLETSLKKMVIHGRWALPQRLQSYFRALTASPLADRELKKEAGGFMASMPDVKRARCVTRPPQETLVTHVSWQTTASPVLGLFRRLSIRALETHLKKKSLEIKFQLPVAGFGMIKQGPLPKCPRLSSVVKPRGAVFFVEPEALLKISLNLKHKYLTYLWGLAGLHGEFLKKMFGSVPEWPEKNVFFRKEAKRQGFGTRSLRFPKEKASFLTDKALDLLESHVQCKKLQHEWGLPSTLQKSLRAFAPEAPRSAISLERPAMRPCCAEVSVTPQSPPFLDLAAMTRLEEHVRSRTAAHTWGIPKRVQQSLKMFLPPSSLSRGDREQARTLLCQCGQAQQASAKPPQSIHDTAMSRHVSPRGVPSQERGTQEPLLRAVRYPAEPSPEEMHQGKTRRHGRKTPEKKPRLEAKLLTSQARDLLEFHMRHKRVQHEWGMPATVQKSLRAFAPLLPDSRVRIKPRAGTYLSARRPQATETSVPFQATMFLDRDIRNCLEAHVRSWTTAHRWGLPKLVQDSLEAFLAVELCSQAHSHQSPRQHKVHFDSERVESLVSLQVEHRAPGKPGKGRQGQRVAGRRSGPKVIAVISPAKKLSFLTDQTLGLLEFHIQHKKLQHLWGLPSTALKSLHAFSPFPFKTEKDKLHTAKIITDTCPWVRGEARVLVPGLLFLSPDTVLRLDAHLGKRIAKHQWGLPAVVQQSLKGFLPPTSSPQPRQAQARPVSTQPPKSLQVAAAGEGCRDNTIPRRRTTANRKSIHPKEQGAAAVGRLKATAFSFPARKLPFLAEEARELLEFHMQHKKIQRMWGLPSAVLKSLRAFAPFPREPEKHTQDAVETPMKRRLWDTEVCIPEQNLFFLAPDTKDTLEAHVRSRTAEHKWGLPKLVQNSLRALLPPASLLRSGDTRQPMLHLDSESPQGPAIPPQRAIERSVRKIPSRREVSEEREKETSRATSPVASATPPATSLMAELPFLTDSKHDVLEFHIQRKKLQHEWGVPALVQRSMRVFAPVPPEVSQGRSSTAGGNAAAAEAGVGTKQPWIAGTVNVAVPSLRFLDSDTKENLEAHLRNLTLEHRWGLPRLVQKSLRAFIPLPSHLDLREMEDPEDPSRDKSLVVSDAQSPTEGAKEGSSEDQLMYHSALWCEMEQGGGTASRLDTEGPLFYSGTKPEQAMATVRETGGWKTGRESPQRSPLQRRPRHFSKATQRQRSKVSDPQWEARTQPLSSSSLGPKKYRSETSSQSMNLPGARHLSGRISTGRAPIPRSSKTALQNQKGRSQQSDRGFQRMAEGSQISAGAEQPQEPEISYSSWELGRKNQAYICDCYLRAYQDGFSTLLPSGAEQRREKAKGMETDSSEDADKQSSGLSSEESPGDGSHPKQEPLSAHVMPVSAGVAPQRSLPIAKKATSSLVKPSGVVRPHTLGKDPSGRPHRQAGRVRHGKTNGRVQKRDSGLGWEKKKVPPHLPVHQQFVRARGRRSSQDLCKACRSHKPPPPVLKGSENPISEPGSSSPDSGESNQGFRPVPKNQDSSEKKNGFPGHPADDLLAETDNDAAGQKTTGGTVSSYKEPRPLSTGGLSQFSTECEWEKVGDWETDEEDTGGRESLGQEQGGSPLRETPRAEISPKAQRSLKCADSPGAKQPQTSPNHTVRREEGTDLGEMERKCAIGPASGGQRTTGREASVAQTVRTMGPEGIKKQSGRGEEDKTLHGAKEESRKGTLPSKEVRHSSSHVTGIPRALGPVEREALKMLQEISKGIQKQYGHPRFIQGVDTKETCGKLSLLGRIVEKKLLLQQGYRVWVQNQEREKGNQKRVWKSAGVSFQTTRTARVKWVKVQCCCGSWEVAKPQRSDRALPARPPQARNTRPPVAPGNPQAASGRSKKAVTQRKSRSRERKR